MQQSEREFAIPSEEVEACFSPAIHRVIDGDDAEWNRTANRLKVKFERQARPGFFRALFSRRRTEKAVKHIYEQQWSPEAALSRLDLSSGKPDPIVWGDRRYLANSIGTKRVHLLFLMRLIEVLKPARILEVGSGTGQNLFILAARFPELAFTGMELTEAGFRTAEALRSSEDLPEPLSTFSPLPVLDPDAHHRVELLQASATDMPFPDRRFDLVYSIQALEQMEQVRDRALSEIARVCSGNTAMFEPFADWNQTPIRRDQIMARNFFSAAIADLNGHALQPIFCTDDMPSKLVHGIGLAVARRS